MVSDDGFKAIAEAIDRAHNNAITLALFAAAPVPLMDDASDYEKQAYDIRTLICEKIRELKR